MSKKGIVLWSVVFLVCIGIVGYAEEESLISSMVSEKLIARIDISSWIPASFRVSSDSKRVAYAAKVGNKQFVVVDGKEGKKYDGIGEGTPIFSPDSKKVAYTAQVGRKQFVVVDEKAGKKYDNIGKGDPIFSPDSKRIAYTVQVGNKQFVVVDGKEETKYDGIVKGTLAFSPNSELVAYGAVMGKKQFVVVNGNEGTKYDIISKPTFSPNSKRVFYGAVMGDKQFVVVDGKEETKYDGIAADSVIFSPDSKRVAYMAQVHDKQLVVVDGKEENKYDSVSNLIFSPDSKRVAYVAQVGNKQFAVVDGKEEKKYDRVSNLIFSPDSKRVAYGAQTGDDKWFVVVDEKEGKKYDIIIPASRGRIIFDSPDSLHYLALEGADIYLVVVIFMTRTVSPSGLELSGEADYSMWYDQVSYRLDLVFKNVGRTPVVYDLIRVDHISADSKSISLSELIHASVERTLYLKSTRKHLHRQAVLPVAGSKAVGVGEQYELHYEISGERAESIANLPDNTLIIVDVFHSGQVVAAFFSFLPSLTRFDEIKRPAHLPFIVMPEQAKPD